MNANNLGAWILKTNGKSEGTGQKSFDDEVSEFVIPSNKRMISEMKMCESPFTFSSKNAYIAYVKRLSI